MGIKSIRIRFEIALVLALASFVVEAGTQAFTYQGVLRGATGEKLEEKNHVIEFRIYDQAAGGSPHWGRKVPVLLDDDGLFAVELASTTNATELIDGVPCGALSEVFAANAGTALYLGLTVSGSNGEIKPRQKLLAAPYASYAADVSAAGGTMSVSNALNASYVNVTGSLTAREVKTSGGASFGSLKTGGAVSAAGVVPIGGIITWSGAENAVPYGWALCDGQISNGRKTPDLRDRFIVGAGSDGSYAVGSTGGEASHALTAGEMPAHSHSSSPKTAGYKLVYNNKAEVVTFDGSSKDNGRRNITSGSAGGGEAHENRPPYYALSYIMRVL